MILAYCGKPIHLLIKLWRGLLGIRDFYDDLGNFIDFNNAFRLRFGQ